MSLQGALVEMHVPRATPKRQADPEAAGKPHAPPYIILHPAGAYIANLLGKKMEKESGVS